MPQLVGPVMNCDGAYVPPGTPMRCMRPKRQPSTGSALSLYLPTGRSRRPWTACRWLSYTVRLRTRSPYRATMKRSSARRNALDRLADADPGSRADVFARAGGARGAAATERGLDLLYRSVAIYERLPPGPGHVKALGDIAWILNYNGRHSDAADVVDQAAAVAVRAGLHAAGVQHRSTDRRHRGRRPRPTGHRLRA